MRSEHSQKTIARARDRYRSRDGLGRDQNGQLLRLVAADFDIFITSDKNLRYQQNLAAFDLAVILLPSNQVPGCAGVTSAD